MMAAGAAFADDFDFSRAASVPESALAEVRGGFEMPASLRASLRLERAAYVNGELVASMTVDIPDIANMTVEQAGALRTAAGTLVLQNGPDNSFSLAALGPAATVIQNTLNDQHLMALTTLSVGVNTLGLMKDLHFQDALHVAQIPGVR